ncbi:MAG: tetratricopeptide repeat protein [Nannocystales bacterium]
MTSEGSECGADAPTAVVSGTVADDAPSENPEPAFIPPERVDRYVLGRMLGAGGLGIVFEAWDPKLERHVAVKLVRNRRRRTELRGAERFLREAQALARLSHPNVVGVYGVGTCEDGKTVYVVMEHVRGQTLRTWAQEGSRSPEELLEVFGAAGRGLAAAHAAGIVHRDFKPDNVMVDEDGRVRVLDFGLALVGEHGGASSGLESVSSVAPAHGESSVEGRLTEIGIVMGTPVYMSPEQHVGRPVSPASDQYSFCVAFLRLLWGGKRVFAGRTAREMAIAKARGRIETRPEGSAVPRWLEKVLTRGLQPEPRDRWPSMDALLRSLQRRSVKARWGGAVGALGLAAAVVGVAASTPQDSDCVRGAQRMGSAWDADAQALTSSSILESLGPRGADVVARLRGRLDADVEAWHATYLSSCDAYATARIDDAMFDRRMSCLRRRVTQRERLISGTASDSARAARVPELLLQLESIEACADDEALAEAGVLWPLPESPARKAEAEAVRVELSRVSELSRAGKFGLAREALADLTPRIMSLGFDPLVAELRYAQGQVAAEEGNRERAAEVYEDALAAAEACGHDVVAAAVASDLVFLYSTAFRRFEEAERLMAYADAMLDRAGRPAHLQRKLAHSAMSFYSRQQRYDEALEVVQAALPEQAPQTVQERYTYSISLNNLALLHMRKGEDRRAEALLVDALALREEALGVDHPKLGTLHLNVAKAMVKNGKYTDAEPHLNRSIALLSILGDDHLAVARPFLARGVVRKKQGRLDEARTDYERALELARKGGRVQMEAMVLANLGNLEKRSGNIELALQRHAEALAMRQAELGPEHLDVASSYGDIASLYRRTERFEEAWEHLDRELSIKRKALDDDHPKLVSTYQRRANLALDQKNYTRARSELDDAFRVLQRHGLEDTAAASSFVSLGRLELEQESFTEAIRAYREGLQRYEMSSRSPGMLGATRLGLAKALWASGDHAAARDALSRARVELRRSGPGAAEDLEELETIAVSWSGPAPVRGLSE